MGASHAPGRQDGLVATRRNLMPLPATVEFRGAPLLITREFSVAVRHPGGEPEARVQRATARMVARLARQTGIPIEGATTRDVSGADLVVEYLRGVPSVQGVIEDESYTLAVGGGRAHLQAPTPYGVLRGLETFLQLVEVRPGRRDASGELAPEPDDFVVPGVLVRDAPRFPWRGLLIDPGRHHLPVEVIKRNLDAMAAVKLNVLHWHLSEDQGFRIESKVFPRLHELGSDGRYYTQDEVREIIEYARDRGIRVMPEFDMPGHTASWFVGYPELASAPGPYEIIEAWGIQDPVMDPTREGTYEFLDAFISEMAALFPDAYFHIGGDEVNGNHWDASPAIRRFIRDNDLVDDQGLQAYFNRRVLQILQKNGKRMVGWDEIFHSDLPRDAVVQSWRGQESLAGGARQGYQGILSNGYYIDLMYPAAQHYVVDPLGEAAADLTAEERARILGGEACMWGEYVVGETIDSRIWPRTAAIAERFWSPASVVEVDDMYRRLATTSTWLEWTGLTHRSGYSKMLRRLTGGRPIDALRTLTDVTEPVKGYRRGGTRPYTRFTPLNRLVDAARPESDVARRFENLVDRYVADSGTTVRIRESLVTWRDNHDALLPVVRASSLLPEAEVLSANLRAVAETGLQALDDIDQRRPVADPVHRRRVSILEEASEPHGALQLMIVESVHKLVNAVGEARR